MVSQGTFFLDGAGVVVVVVVALLFLLLELGLQASERDMRTTEIKQRKMKKLVCFMVV